MILYIVDKSDYDDPFAILGVFTNGEEARNFVENYELQYWDQTIHVTKWSTEYQQPNREWIYGYDFNIRGIEERKKFGKVWLVKGGAEEGYRYEQVKYVTSRNPLEGD